MELRSALPVAVLVGGVIGLAAVGGPDPEAPAVALAAEPVLEIAADAASQWDIPVVRNAPVERFVDLFTGKQSDRMALYLKRSGRYEGDDSREAARPGHARRLAVPVDDRVRLQPGSVLPR